LRFLEEEMRPGVSWVRYADAMNALITATIASALIGSSVAGLSLPATFDASQQETVRAFEMPFELVDNRIIVSAQINGVGPIRLLLDTGADEGFVTNEAGRRLHLLVTGEEEESGTGAATVRMGKTMVKELRIGQAVFRDLSMLLSSSDDFSNVFGSRSPDGVIGQRVFERYVVRVDYQKKLLTFTPPAQYAAPVDAKVVKFDLPRQIPVVDAELDGVRGRFGVDTGARSSLLVYRPFAEKHKLREKYGAHIEAVTGWGIGGPIRSLLLRSRDFSLAGFDVKGSVVRLSTLGSGATTSSSMAGLIGPDILERFVVTFDYSRRQMLLEKSKDFARVDSYDRAGVWMGQSGQVFFAVDVVADGPADIAGIRKGDRLLEIDGVATTRLILPDVRERMRRSAVGSTVRMLVEHEGTRRVLEVRLRDLV
jgi:PDZ domain/Aspartyl protease